MFYGFFLLQRPDFFKRGENSGFLIFPLSKNLKGFLRNDNDQNMYTEMNSSWKNEIKRRIQAFLTFEAKSFGEMINIFYAGMTYLYLNVEIICIIKCLYIHQYCLFASILSSYFSFKITKSAHIQQALFISH